MQRWKGRGKKPNLAASILPSKNTLPEKVILLEPSALKVARSVLRGKGDSDVPALPDNKLNQPEEKKERSPNEERPALTPAQLSKEQEMAHGND